MVKRKSKGSLLGRSSSSSKDKTGLYLVSIVAIVAVVALFLMVKGGAQTSSEEVMVVDEEGNIIGMAFNNMGGKGTGASISEKFFGKNNVNNYKYKAGSNNDVFLSYVDENKINVPVTDIPDTPNIVTSPLNCHDSYEELLSISPGYEDLMKFNYVSFEIAGTAVIIDNGVVIEESSDVCLNNFLLEEYYCDEFGSIMSIEKECSCIDGYCT